MDIIDFLKQIFQQANDIVSKFWAWRKVLLLLAGGTWALFCLHKLILVLKDYKDFFGGKKND